MGQKGERDVLPPSAQVARRGTDARYVEPFRSPFHRLAPVVLAALGILGALLTIFAGLVALNHSVLPFKGWPLDAERLNTGTQVLPRAPVETGRLRTAPGGALAAAPEVVAALATGSSPVLHGAVAPTLSVVPGVTIRIRHRASHPVTHPTESKPAPAPQLTAPAPAPAPAPVAAPTPAPAPVATPVVSSPAPIARRPVSASRQPSTATSTTSVGNGGGAGRAKAPGQLKKIAAAAAPAGAPVATPATPPAVAANVGPGNGNGHGHGPPPWAHGHH